MGREVRDKTSSLAGSVACSNTDTVLQGLWDMFIHNKNTSEGVAGFRGRLLIVMRFQDPNILLYNLCSSEGLAEWSIYWNESRLTGEHLFFFLHLFEYVKRLEF